MRFTNKIVMVHLLMACVGEFSVHLGRPGTDNYQYIVIPFREYLNSEGQEFKNQLSALGDVC